MMDALQCFTKKKRKSHSIGSSCNENSSPHQWNSNRSSFQSEIYTYCVHRFVYIYISYWFKNTILFIFRLINRTGFHKTVFCYPFYSLFLLNILFMKCGWLNSIFYFFFYFILHFFHKRVILQLQRTVI